MQNQHHESFDEIDEVVKTFGVETHFQNKIEITNDVIRNNVEKTLTVQKLYCKIISLLENTFFIKSNDSNKLYSPDSIGKLGETTSSQLYPSVARKGKKDSSRFFSRFRKRTHRKWS